MTSGKALRRHTIRFILPMLALLAFAASGRAQVAKTNNVTVQGQLVCSLCWFEADRKTTPYGSPADIDCARDCAEKNIPPAVAVPQGDGYKLYLFEEGNFKKTKADWMDYIGKQVEVSGRAHSKKEKDYIAGTS